MYNDQSSWNLLPSIKPNASRIFVSWGKDKIGKIPSKEILTIEPIETEPNDDDHKSITNQIETSLIVELQPNLEMANKTKHLIASDNSKPKTESFATSHRNTTSPTITITTTTTAAPTTNSTTPKPVTTVSIAPVKNSTLFGKPITKIITNSTVTTRKPVRKINGGGRFPLNGIESDELHALRPPSRSPEGEQWIEQIHAITTPRPYDQKRDCGIRSLPPEQDKNKGQLLRRARVVGGRNSQMGEFPWSVLIRETSMLGFLVKTKCGGVLIDLKWVLTAAHCKPGMFGSLVVMVGEHDLDPSVTRTSSTSSDQSSSSFRLRPAVKKVKRMIIHRDYNPNNFDNDIALLELEAPFKIQPHVTPICLPEKEEEFIGKSAMVAGWGKLSFGGPVPSVLQVARLPVIGNKQCQDMYHRSGHIKIISDSFVCAGYPNGGMDSCEGDSGGPLQLQRNDSRWVLVGTVSHGIKCAEPNLPGIYIRTTAYLPWIKAVMFHQDQNKRYGH